MYAYFNIDYSSNNQEGRRNLTTKAHQEYLSGKRYLAQKDLDKFKGNQHVTKDGEPISREDSKIGLGDETGERGGHQNDDHQKKNRANFTAAKQGVDEGVSENTIVRNEKFAQGVDALRVVSPELANTVLNTVVRKGRRPCPNCGDWDYNGKKRWSPPSRSVCKLPSMQEEHQIV